MDANIDYIDYAFKLMVGGGLIMLLTSLFELKGSFNAFMTNHWPHFQKKFDVMVEQVKELDNRTQRLEDRGDMIGNIKDIVEVAARKKSN